jgi:hypothetical protein
MKNIMLFLMLGVFIFGASGFKVNKLPPQEDCDNSFDLLYDFAISNGATESVAQNQASTYWVNCVNAGGSTQLFKTLELFAW